MRRFALPLLLLIAGPTLAVAQTYKSDRTGDPAIAALSDPRRVALLPNEVVGFRILGDQARTLRVSTGHLREGRLYHAVARIVPSDGSPATRVEGTVSAETPTLQIGTLPAGEYIITVHLEDYATGSTRDARNKVVLR
ncbi:MAG TPA: hypothetical protein VF454_00900 [Gemmatimonadales bacterium]